MRHCIFATAFALGITLLSACGQQPATGPARLAPVDALAAQKPVGPIASFSPTGNVDTLAQIRVIFRDDLIPVERLESTDEQGVLAKFSVTPALPGRFRFLTPRMIGFQADAAIPLATQVRVTIAKGLRDRAGHELSTDFAWTFHTAPIALDVPNNEPTSEPSPGPLLPRITVTSNTALDATSLAAHASLVPAANGAAVALQLPPNSPATGAGTSAPTPAPNERFDPSDKTWSYTLTPATTLAKAATYNVVFAPGILPKTGNLATGAPVLGKIATFGALKFGGLQQVTDQGDRLSSGVPTLTFNNPVDPKSLTAIHVDPAPQPGTLAGRIDDNTIGLNPLVLAPNTDYAVTIGPALADTFGQTLGETQHATFRTGDRSAQLWAPDGTHLFPSMLNVNLNVTVVNLGNGTTRARFHALTPNDIVTNDDPSGEVSPLLGPVAMWPVFATAGTPNVERTIGVPLREATGGAGVLAYGVQAVTGMRTNDKGVALPSTTTDAGLVQLTNLGTFAQWFPDGGIVRVNHLTDGAPVAGARVDIFRSQADANVKTDEPACATALTGADGFARFAGSSFARCAALDNGKNAAPALVTIVHEGYDWTFVRTDDGTGAYTSGMYTGWSSATPMSRGTIFSDRDLYQPGETVQLTAVGWFLTHGVLARGAAPNYSVELRLPNDEKRTLARLTLNAYGTGSIAIPIAKSMPLGYYSVRATAGNGEEITGSFRVAEFKPPNFKVAVSLPQTTAVAGDSINASTTSTYLFGSPVQGATTTYDVTRDIANYTWPTDGSYAFGPQWFWPEQQPAFGSDVLHVSVPVDANGVAVGTIPVAADLPFPMQYRVDAETTDVSNLSVGDSKSFTAYPGPVQIGLKTDFVATAGEPANISLIALDPHGTVVPDTKVHIELQKATYATATRVVEGADMPEEAVTYATVANTDVTSAAAPVAAKLTPTEAGTYRIRANPAGAKTNATETDVQLYVAGSGEARWGDRDPDRLQVHLDKTKYQPGDVAHALIQSPFPDADIAVSVVRNKQLWRTIVHAHGSAPTVAFTVTPAMLPNAAFEAVAVRRGKLPTTWDDSAGNAVARSGFAAFEVALDDKYVAVSVKPELASLAPAGHQTVALHVTDRAHHAIRGQLTVIVANDAVLQLSGYRPPDLVQLVYSDQPISTRFADNRQTIVLQTLKQTIDKGWGYGGGLSTGAEDTRIRRNFQPLAYYAASLITDANGNATASFDMPDDLTTWRVMAIAATTDGRFGNADATFVTNKPLMVNPLVPQFARPGDTFDAGVSITTGPNAGPGTIAVSGALTSPLAFLTDEKSVAATSFSAPIDAITKAYRFPMIASGVGTSTATFKAGIVPKAQSSASPSARHDAFAIPVTVSDRAVMESVITTGVSASPFTIPIDIAAGTPRDAGGVQLVLANSLIPDAIVAAQGAFADDSRLALTSAGRLNVAADVLRLTALTKTIGTTVDARANATSALAFLATQQRADGGFTSYPDATASDPFDSLAVLHALAQAKGASLAVNPGMMRRAQTFAASALADPGQWSWCKKDPCLSALRLHALDALADAGDRRTTFLGDVDAARAQLTLADQIRLARYLVATPGYAVRGAAEAQPLVARVTMTGALGTFNLAQRYSWFARPVVAQALMTRLLVAQHADAATIDRLTRSLLALRRNGSWGCACESAVALDALVDVAARAGTPPNFTATATLGRTVLGAAAFTGNRASSETTSTAAARLPAGSSPITVAKTGSGNVHYALTYSYRLSGPQPGVLGGLRVTRSVRAAGATDPLATMGLSLTTAPVTLASANVFDVELQIITDHPVDRVRITDPLPAGLEAVDTSFATTNAKRPSQSWQIDDQQIYHDRIEAYADHLGPGVYVFHYLARAVTPGTFAWPGANAQLADQPQEFGRTASATLTIK